MAAHAVAVWARARASTVGLVGGRRLGLAQAHPLVGMSRTGPGSSGRARDAEHRSRGATWGVCGSDRRARVRLRRPCRATARDTARPLGVTVRSQPAGAAPTARPIQGWRRQQWQFSVAEEGSGRGLGSHPARSSRRSRRAEGESPKPGSGVAPGVLVTISRLQRLERGISPGERVARQCDCGSAG